jgi:ABC-2 type transport system ATP-binding protein
MEALMYSNAVSASTIVYCSHHMDEVERLADNLIVMEGGRLRLTASPDELRSRVSRWISDIPFRGPPPAEIPGLLQAERIDGLHHHIVLEQDDGFAAFLRSRGARIVERTEVDLETAMNALLAGPEAGGSES